MNPINPGPPYNSSNPGNPYPPSELPGQNPGVWPPPPTGGIQPQALTFPFKTEFYTAGGSVPLFRVGTLSLYPEGVSIQGKAVPRYEIQVPILIASALLVGFLIVYLLLEYAFRGDAMANIPWAEVRGVTLVPKQRRICLVYDAPNYKGITKTFSLAFRPGPAAYDAFVQNIQIFLPDRVTEGKLSRWTSPAVWIFLVAIVFGILVQVALASLTHGVSLSNGNGTGQ